MGRAITLREDFKGPVLRRLAKASRDAGQSRRLLALAEIYDGGRRTDAARIGDVGLQVIRDWVLRFNAKGPKAKRRANGPSSMRINAKPLQGWLNVGQFQRSTVWCVGDVRTWRFGYLKSLASRSRSRASAVSCGRWGSARYRHGRATRGRTSSRSRILKKLPRRVGGDPSQAPGQHRHRNLVARRGPGRPEDQAHAALGATRQPTHGAQGPTHEIGLPLWRHLP